MPSLPPVYWLEGVVVFAINRPCLALQYFRVAKRLAPHSSNNNKSINNVAQHLCSEQIKEAVKGKHPQTTTKH